MHKKILGFDFLKVAAASFIVLHHYQQVFELKFSGINFFDGRFNFGYFVELFFIISGFLTLYSDKSGGAIRCLKHKLLRVFPITTIACIVTLIFKSIQASNISELWNFKTIFANIFLLFSGYPLLSMTGINNPTWYLCILIQCYIIFYIIRWLSNKFQIDRLWFDVAIIVLAIVLHYLGFIPIETYRGFESFSIGLILCRLKDVIPQNRIIAVSLLICSVVLIVLIPSQQRRILTFISFPSLVILCIWIQEWTQKKLSNKVQNSINTFGLVSFEVYIWHYPIMAFEKMVTSVWDFEIDRGYLTMLTFLIIVWIFAYIIYRFVENPINNWIKEKSK